MYTHNNTSKCRSEREIFAAVRELRAKAKRQPSYRDGDPFMVLANEFLRILYRHRDSCQICGAAGQ
jgi:hypothetical protein